MITALTDRCYVTQSQAGLSLEDVAPVAFRKVESETNRISYYDYDVIMIMMLL